MAKKEGGEGNKGNEGENLLGPPTFKELENGRFKCIETGHEVPAHGRESYAQSKHCRMGLIDAALSHNKPPLNMFRQDPLSCSKLTCKLTGVTINKSQEHIWKHINGKHFLNMLENMVTEKQTPNSMIREQSKQTPKTKPDSSKKKKKKQEDDISKIISEVRDSSDKDSDLEEADLWMPPAGDSTGDQRSPGSELGPEADYVNGADSAMGDGDKDAVELSKRTKRMSIEIGPSSFASRKKKKKTKST